ncbi:prepilin-type N-terminal cleavage/methylation domain-containing protein [Paenibacillus apiarius]|uniref:Prepilin-type N-terminal cleavage/methylation domain-containing protein n=1 Tax=Paenibacillus apiarius TaxID=46240 RepID=A0ABT4DMK0_9BACL|nr:prepilin-type N-terminal cleavage/methylation domain-containing protein [Paenibacillus apiarius]MCY9516085.1 prepilin-type N-terminal cleavage/methylation domain-containing protein [Paenibacillus apiarius]MCY9518456.1 prepilin-type N-terminal cleavage/methylation domain-containing protein [Paenibacillus apiarius]MCY9551143.1 prepilin-type N-terminal cleavage/methylation domain-containing protein [Paenibacillus apiarius]MCY9558297.1 prepilin-type N-terminal cleavage/methylation domain-contain
MSMAWVQERVKAARNEKGMTLIELLAVIVILGIIIAIAAVVIIGQFDKAKQTSDDTSAKIVTDAVQRYILDNYETVEISNTPKDIEIEKLVSGGYIKEVPVNSKGKNLELIKVSYIGDTKQLKFDFGTWYTPKSSKP